METNQKKINWLLLIVWGIIITVLFHFIKQERLRQVQENLSGQPKTILTAQEREKVIDQCVESGTMRESCICILDKMMERYTMQELVELNRTLQETGRVKDGEKIAMECYNELFAPTQEI